MKLDIACGQRKQDGYTGIDIAGDPDIVHDLNEYPWPIDTDTVEEAFCSHYVEHIPMTLPDGRDGLIAFMTELHRVCVDGAMVRIIHPYCKSERAFWDPTHRRFIAVVTWSYFNRDWRVAQGLDHYPIDVDFEVVNVGANGIPDDVACRDEETKMRLLAREWDVIADLDVILKVRKT